MLVSNVTSASNSTLRSVGMIAMAVATLALGACASGVKLDDVAANGGSTANGSGNSNFANQPWNDPSSPLYKKSVYFDFDSYVVKAADQSTIDAHAKYLGANKGQKVVIQGNTDNIGTSEYNLALGQKRSEAVRKVLNLKGVSDSQMEAVSFGKEKPRAMGTDDASRAENRRADIAY